MSSSTSSTSDISNGRYWGLATGLDVDSIVSGLLTGEQAKINKAKQKEQTYEWQQSAYQDITSKLSDFEKAYLQIGASSSMATANMYTSYTSTSSNSALITASATSDADGVSQNIQVLQSATKGSITSSYDASTGGIKKNTLSGTASWSDALTALKSAVNASGNPTASISLTLDGVSKDITFSASDFSSVSDTTGFQNLVNNKLQAAFGNTTGTTPKVTASTGGNFGFVTANGYSMNLTVKSTSNVDITGLGLKANQTNTLDIYNTTVGDLTGNTGDVKFSINGKNVDISSGASVSALLSAISNTGVASATYDSAHDAISITSNQTGAASGITITPASDDNGNTAALFGKLGISSLSSTNQQDAIVSINGTSYSRSSNKFTISGVTYSINETVSNSGGKYTVNGGTPSDSAPSTALTFTNDPSALEKGINTFISAYNTLLDAIHTQTDTKPDSDYAPLTDAQKSSMTTDQINAWNTKAQAGVLFDDSALESICDQMRSALYAKVKMSDGSTFSLYQMGVTTSDDPKSYGKLEVKDQDQTKFNNACATQADKIKQLFTNSSGASRITLTQYSTALSTSMKNGSGSNASGSSAGLTELLDDVIQLAAGYDGVHYGTLVQKAGTSTLDAYNNTLYNYIKQQKTDISDLQDEMKTKKNALYTKFQNLETFMEQANSQSSMISSFGSK